MCTSGIDNLNRYNPDVYYRLENPAKKKRLSKLSVKNKKKTFLDAFSSFDWNYFLQQAKEKSDPPMHIYIKNGQGLQQSTFNKRSLLVIPRSTCSKHEIY